MRRRDPIEIRMLGIMLAPFILAGTIIGKSYRAGQATRQMIINMASARPAKPKPAPERPKPQPRRQRAPARKPQKTPQFTPGLVMVPTINPQTLGRDTFARIVTPANTGMKAEGPGASLK